MRTRILICGSIVLLATLVSSHSNVKVVEVKKPGSEKLIKANVDHNHFIIKERTLSALNDAVVPKVPESPTTHTSFASLISESHTPDPMAMVRGPTTALTRLIPFSRDKPV